MRRRGLAGDVDRLRRRLRLDGPLRATLVMTRLRGRPWNQAASHALGTQRGFEQLGWIVDLARYDEGWVVASRATAPAVTLRAKIDLPS